MASQITGECLVCGTETKNRCSRCLEAGVDLFFCSPEHQRLVWFAHRLLCGPGKANPPVLLPLSPEEIDEAWALKETPLASHVLQDGVEKVAPFPSAFNLAVQLENMSVESFEFVMKHIGGPVNDCTVLSGKSLLVAALRTARYSNPVEIVELTPSALGPRFLVDHTSTLLSRVITTLIHYRILEQPTLRLLERPWWAPLVHRLLIFSALVQGRTYVAHERLTKWLKGGMGTGDPAYQQNLARVDIVTPAVYKAFGPVHHKLMDIFRISYEHTKKLEAEAAHSGRRTRHSAVPARGTPWTWPPLPQEESERFLRNLQTPPGPVQHCEIPPMSMYVYIRDHLGLSVKEQKALISTATKSRAPLSAEEQLATCIFRMAEEQWMLSYDPRRKVKSPELMSMIAFASGFDLLFGPLPSFFTSFMHRLSVVAAFAHPDTATRGLDDEDLYFRSLERLEAFISVACDPEQPHAAQDLRYRFELVFNKSSPFHQPFRPT
ncbi:hypothetical protein JCM10296v2_003334 [Rhodotorula toruloides]